MEEAGASGAESGVNDVPSDDAVDFVISPLVHEAVAKAIYEYWRSETNNGAPWEEVEPDWRNGTMGQAQAAIVALFNSWPNFCFSDPVPGGAVPGFILPVEVRHHNDD